MSRKPYAQLSKRRKRDYLRSLFHSSVDNVSSSSSGAELNDGRNQIDQPYSEHVVVEEHEAASTSTIHEEYHLNVFTNDVPNQESLSNDNVEGESENNIIRNESDNQDENEESENEIIERQNESDEETDDRFSDDNIIQNEDENNEEDNNRENENNIIENESDDEDDDRFSEPLYPEAPLTANESMMLVLDLYVKHNITQTLLSDILNVINLHSKNSNETFYHSLYKFRKHFSLTEENDAVVIRHYYCSSCMKSLTSSRELCEECEILGMAGVSYFIEIPISLQLQEMFKRRNFYDRLQHPPEPDENNVGTLSDIYDGFLYRQMVHNGFLNNKNNISLTWYCDGVPIFKSSKISMWPLYLTINELPISERKKRSNLIVAALWFGKNKPDANLFVEKLQPEFEDLYSGYNFMLHDGTIKTVRCVLLYGTCDLPAKAQFLNLVQFNGEYGCHCCTCSGEDFILDSGGRTWVFPYTVDSTIRTCERTKRYAEIAAGANNPVMGVKGPCVFANLMPDFIAGTTIDRMHGVDGGVMKKLLTLWFDSTYSAKNFSLYPVINVIDERLKLLKPPKFIHRMPRSIKDLIHWKTSELKSWLFYYSVPLLADIMTLDYFQHFLLLVAAISYLSSNVVTVTMIHLSENFLQRFVREFEEIYGLEFCSMNIHQLLHLTQCVRNNGPLWAYTCYKYEDLNGQFLRLIHGTRHIDSQIATAHTQLLKMQQHLEELPDGPIKAFCDSHRQQVKICEKISDNCYSVGTYKKFTETSTAIRQTVRHLINNGIIRTYNRILKDNKLYIAENYPRNLQTVSSYTVYKDSRGNFNFGSIYYFIKHVSGACECRRNQCECNGAHYAIVRALSGGERFVVNGDNNIQGVVPHIYRVVKEEYFNLISINSLQNICVHIEMENGEYVAIPINSEELE